jgi:hypothetical protein
LLVEILPDEKLCYIYFTNQSPLHMKALSISGLVISILGFLAAMYEQFILAPADAALEASIDTGQSDELTSMMWYATHETMVSLGEGLILVCGLSLILSVIPAMKTKSKLAWTGVVLSVIAVVIGLVNGTHMFS